MNNILTVKNLTKTYGNKQMVVSVLNGIDFEVEKGLFLGIMGPSGSGKTTLLNILSTIDSADSGQIILNGVDIATLNRKNVAAYRRDNIGFVFQDFNLLDNMTIEDNIALPLALNSVPVQEIKTRVYKFAEMLGIPNQLKKYPYQLSGGQKQRVATARALISKPEVLFADEPTGALDTKASADLLHCFEDVNKQIRTTIFMVTHDANAASFCDKVMFLKDGKIYADIYKTENRQDFYQKILHNLSVLGGGSNECI